MRAVGEAGRAGRAGRLEGGLDSPMNIHGFGLIQGKGPGLKGQRSIGDNVALSRSNTAGAARAHNLQRPRDTLSYQLLRDTRHTLGVTQEQP
eukprot:366029-Chlamydomonas_euryale.AAC.32